MKSEIVIVEQAGAKRELRLQGPALPKQGANWGGKNRLVTTWYPGNSQQATQQVLGPTEIPTNWAGIWRSTMLHRTPAIFVPRPGTQQRLVFADGLREIFEDILRRSALLLVYWISAETTTFGGRSITRTGRASDWNFNYARVDDIDWTVTWEWTGRGLSQQRVTQFRTDGTNQSNMALMAAITQAVQEAASRTKMQLSKRTIPNSASKFTLGQIEQILDAPGQLMKDFSQSMRSVETSFGHIADIVSRTKGLPYEIASQALDIATGAIQTANRFNDQISQKPPELLQTQNSLAALTRAASFFKGGQDAADIVVSRTYPISADIRAQIDARRASGANGNAQPLTNNAAASLNGKKTEVQTYVVRQSDTLLGISLQFYGVIEGAYGIAFANGLSLKAYPPVGKVLIIPPLNTGPRGTGLPPVAPAGGQITLPGGLGKLPGSP